MLNQSTTSKKEDKKWSWWLLLIFLQIIVLAVLVYFIYGYMKNINQNHSLEPAETKQTEQTEIEQVEPLAEIIPSDSEDYCPAGFTTEKSGSTITVIGKEKIKVGGQEVELCCTEVEAEETGRVKTCQDENGDYMVVIKDDERVESYPQNGQKCIHGFDKNGNEMFKLCL